ncbi:hypothetical protein [Streptomyces sp. AB3(2024)]|uniref:hypothetical protein n=1 Tax=Streptomyces sp. AB3(2024) TaxID=3317321 RepID=UPI0035A2E096
MVPVDTTGRAPAAAAHGGADVMGLAHADFTPGAPAGFVLVEGEGVPRAVRYG